MNRQCTVVGHDPLVDWPRIGRTLRALRITARLTQVELARRAGVPRDHVATIERGRAEDVRLSSLGRTAAVLGATLDVRLRWRGEQLDRLLDEAHAATVAATVERLTALGWEVAIEVSFSIWGERGSVDILAWHATTRTLLVVEVKSVLADLQSLLHGLDRKARLAAAIAAERGWTAAEVGRLVVLADSPTSRGRVRRVEAVLGVALPFRGPALRRWLAAPSGPMAGLLFLSNAGQAGNGTPLWRRERVRGRRARGIPSRAPVRHPSMTDEPSLNRNPTRNGVHRMPARDGRPSRPDQ